MQETAKAFSRHQFEKAVPFLASTIRWNLVGEKTLEGQESVIDACKQSANYLTQVTTTFIKFKVIVGDNEVVVDSVATYTNQQQESTKVASCDIYEFADGLVTEITSYSVDLIPTH
ncbi:nuclear transport factor 2 family protein [uncultured Hymenobacter sp.]|uniref:nuclear transport factor 2 family protein n=1 Tax=uncultured Hymenobacter sp. TaxID=170016 RepID=UPI0035CC0CE4